MQRTPQSRKRPAPGAEPIMQQPTVPQANYDYSQQIPQNSDYGNFDFSQFANDQAFPDPATLDLTNPAAAYLNAGTPAQYPSNLQPSTDLVRRSRNQQLAPQNGQQEQWNGQYNMADGRPAPYEENEQDLAEKVHLAKRDAQGKRKQIPPFVQKLSR